MLIIIIEKSFIKNSSLYINEKATTFQFSKYTTKNQ